MRRPHYLTAIAAQFRVHSVCALLGPRQVGKTTLARMYAEQVDSTVHLFDLENPLHLAKLEVPMLALERLEGLVIIDEIQRRPELFPVLRVLVDRPGNKVRFLILGSASRDLIRQSSESLAGRIGYIELTPFALDEVGAGEVERLWCRGGYPHAYLAATDEESMLWRQGYVTTFLERDIPELGFEVPPQHLRRFLHMLAHYHGQIFNASEIGNSLSVSHHTVRKYLDILTGTFMVRQLTPWFENLGKRQVKSPKMYFRDSGILHTFMGIAHAEELYNHPKLGASWEGFALEEVTRHLHATPEECFFWATHAGAELDLFILKQGCRLGFEFKYTDSPKVTASMRTALSDLRLDHLYVVCPGKELFPLAEEITVVGLSAIEELSLTRHRGT